MTDNGAWRGGLPDALGAMLPDYLARQRWFSGSEPPPRGSVRVERSRVLWESEDVRLWQAVVSVDDDRYQLLLGERNADRLGDLLYGNELHVVGIADGSCFYDPVIDSEAALAVLEVSSAGKESATLVRPVGAEQSNTSLVYDDRVILKLYRRLHEGSNPDVEVTTALARVGFGQVSEPLVSWRDGHLDLAFGQRYLAGGTEGWALALTSLRDLYNSRVVDPEEAGGDFAGEAARLGRLTAGMHVAMVRAFGEGPRAESRRAWEALLARVERGLSWTEETFHNGLRAAAIPLLERLGRVPDAGPVQRIHGDFHLGQVMRTDRGWFVLDFEGEPARPLEERAQPASPFKDVAGMLRSFQYASRRALAEFLPADLERLEPLAIAWEARNRQAFLESYGAEDGVAALLPPSESVPAVLVAWEVDKALYELEYEQAHRPDWVGIPMEALERLIDGANHVDH